MKVYRHSAHSRHTILFVDLGLSVQVETQDDHVGQDVHATNKKEDIRVLKGNLLGQLHHHHDDGEVGTATRNTLSVMPFSGGDNDFRFDFGEEGFERTHT